MQLFTLFFNAYAHNIKNQKILLRKAGDSFDTEIIKKLETFHYWFKTTFFRKKHAYGFQDFWSGCVENKATNADVY